MKAKFILILICLTIVFALPAGAEETEALFAQRRARMVEQQVKARGIKDPRVLQAMLTVRRHLFVPPHYRHRAYEDSPLPIGEGQTISQPYIVALMTELLELKGGERVLEIGTGSGYQAAILAELAKEVYTIEILAPLARRAEHVLKEAGYRNIRARVGDGFMGWSECAPFDGIMVTAAPEKIPEPLLAQLAEKGRLVIPVGTHWQELTLVRKTGGRTTATNIAPVRFVPLLREKGMNHSPR